jgi:23S rRNA pseudouridine1911/1915/1917 synthase
MVCRARYHRRQKRPEAFRPFPSLPLLEYHGLVKNAGYCYRDRIQLSDEGATVAEFYSRRYPHFLGDEWRQKIRDGQVLLNGRAALPDDVLRRGDDLAYHRLPWAEPDVPTEFGTLFEDDDVVVLAKPSGLPVLPGGFFLENTLLHFVRGRYGADASPIHRLGRGTSGAILFSRNRKSARFLSRAMSARRIVKVYLALASGTGMPDAFAIDAPIGPVPHALPTTVNAYRADGRPSVSHIRVIRRLQEQNAAVLEVTIPTGRPHQIRIHLSYAGHPLVGDPLYRPGGVPRDDGVDDERPTTPGATGYLLHSWKICFPHPARPEEVEVICPPSATVFREALALRK